MSSEKNPLSGPPRIERPPEAVSFSIEKLIDWARNGRLRIPHFQRRFKWKNEDRIALFDSIERGYPIGTLLLWKRTDNPEEGYLDGALINKASGEAYWLVDGQQRITTLWEALAQEPKGNEPCLSFDFERNVFRFSPISITDIERIPVHVLLDATELSEWLVKHQWPSERMRRAFELGKRIRQYTVPAYIVDADDERVVRHIFDRTNSTGKALTRDEVFDAFAGTAFGKDARKGLDRVNDRLSSLQFGELQRSTILNALEAVLGFRIGKMDLQDLTYEQSDDGLDKTTTALARVIDFLRDTAHIPHVILVPYELPFVVLARFFHVFPKPVDRSRILLRRWLWRGALRQLLTGASGSLQEHVDDIDGNEHNSVQRLLRRSGSGENPVDLEIRKSLSVGTALGRLQACALIGIRPRDLLTGEIIQLGEVFSQGIEKAIRKIVARVDEDNEELERTIANRLIHPLVPGVGPARLLIGCNDQAALISHGVDEEALSALRRGEQHKFLQHRLQRLEGWIGNFARQHAEWGADDSPPIDALKRRY